MSARSFHDPQTLGDCAPAEYVEVGGVAWCVAHDGIIDELSDRVDEHGEPVCNMCDEYDDVCRMVPLYVCVTENGDG